MTQHLQKLFPVQALYRTERVWPYRTSSNSECIFGWKCLIDAAPSSTYSVIRKSAMHTSAIHHYLGAKQLPLPENIEDIAASEKSQFSPQRSRDISGPVILSKTMGTFINNEFATGYNSRSQPSDPRLSSYDCRGPVSLHSSMQTNVPEPFSAKGKPTHLNMPGGQWGQGYKYISDDLQNFHYRNMSQQSSSVE